MTACTFAEFYAACAPKLTDIQLRELNPKAEYFRLVNGHCGLHLEEEGTWVSIFVGGMRDIWELRRIISISGTPKVAWFCRVGSPMYKIAQYYKMKIEESNERYADGAPRILCVVDTLQTLRLQKNKAKSLALT